MQVNSNFTVKHEVLHGETFKPMISTADQLTHSLIQEAVTRDFSSGPEVKNLPRNAGDMGSILDQETKIPHAAGQLSLRTATTEVKHLHTTARENPASREARAHALQ